MDLINLRNRIDCIDTEMVVLFQKRMELSAEIAKYKKSHDLPIFVASREEAVLSHVENIADNEFAGYTREFYIKIMELSKHYQQMIISNEVI